jgi:hypothetical protein
VKNGMNKKILLTLLTIALFLTIAIPQASACQNILLDRVDIGNPQSEHCHFLRGWGPIEPATHGGTWGDFGQTGENCRVVYYNTTDPPDKPWAKLTLYTIKGAAKTLKIRALDGIADDSFEVYVKNPSGKWILVYSYTADPSTEEKWIIHEIELPPKVAKGITLRIKIVLTGETPWWGFDTYGQLAIDWIELWGNGKPRC